ncbi:hypothetical protein ACOSQ3_021527 [Xanthoceras sorbifolium]
MDSSNHPFAENSDPATRSNGYDSSQRKSQVSSLSSSLNFKLSIKLDHNSYNYWRMQVLPAVRAFDLEDFVLNCKKCPEKFVEIAVEGSDQVEQARILQIKTEMNAMRKGALSISEYVLKIKGFSEALGAAGHFMSIDDLISIVTITAKQSHTNLQEVQFLLMSYECTLAHCNTTSAIDLSHASAHYSAHNNRGGYRGGYNRVNIGRTQGRGRGRAGGRNGLKMFCQLCSKNGHVISCWHRFDQNFQGVSHQHNSNNINQHQGGGHHDQTHMSQSVQP